jgi:predicted transcriptional regulator
VPRVTSIRLPEDLVDRLDSIALSLDRSRGWVIRQALVGYVRQHESGPGPTVVEEAESDTPWPMAHQKVIDALEHMIDQASEGAPRASSSQAAPDAPPA